MLGSMLRRLIAAWLRLLIGTLEWFHARTVGPIVDWLDESVLAASEESVKLFVREFFTSAKRLINGFCAHLLGMFDAQYRESLKLTWQQKEAWHSWWREERSSTLNAVLAQSPEAAADTGAAQFSSTRSMTRQRRAVTISTDVTTHSNRSSRQEPSATDSTSQHDTAGSSTYTNADAAIPSSSSSRASLLDSTGQQGALHGRSLSSSGSFSKGQQAGRQVPHIRWQLDSSPRHPTTNNGSSGGSHGGRAHSPFASAAGAAAVAANTAAEDGSNTSSSSSSWLVRAVWWVSVGLLGRAKTLPQVTAAATGTSTNPLQAPPSLPSLTSLISLPSFTISPWGSARLLTPQGSAQLGEQGLGQLGSQGSGPQRPPSRLGPQAGSSSSSADRAHDQQQQQLQQQQCEQQSLAQRVCSSVARKLRLAVSIALLPFVAPLLPGLWLLGCLWGRCRRPTTTAAAAAGAGSVAPGQQQQQQQQPRQAGAGLLRRSIVFEDPSLSFGAQQGPRRRGLLEELSVGTELLVTAVFEALRWVVRATTLTRRHQQQPSARQRRLAAAAAAADGSDGSAGPYTGGSSGSSRPSRRGSNGSSSSSSFRSRCPGSPITLRLDNPFGDSPTAAAAAAAAGGSSSAAVWGALSPEMDPGEEPGLQQSIQQQRQRYCPGQGSPGSTVSSYHSGCSSSGLDTSSSSDSDSEGASDGEGGSSRGGVRGEGGVGGAAEVLRGVGPKPHALLRSKSVGGTLAEFHKGTGTGSTALPRLTLRRVRSVGRWSHHGSSDGSGGGGGSSSAGGWARSAAAAAAAAAGGDDSELTAAAQCILTAGYPLEVHTVTTSDGVVLTMERIPRPGCGRVAFFLHGILDTSLTWVSSGVTGSQAFAAWDQGFDVWLGSSRSNAPRITRDASKEGLRFFSFSLNELGIHDIPAQLDHLHTVKMRELAGSSLRSHGGSSASGRTAAAAGTAAAGTAAAGTAAAGTAAAGGLRVDVHGLDPWLLSEQQAALQHAADSEAVFGRAAAVPAATQQQQQGAVYLQQRDAGWFSPRGGGSSMKRTLSDSSVPSLGRKGPAGGPVGQERQRGGGMLRAAGSWLLGGAGRSRKQQQQQEGGSSSSEQPWQTAAAMAAVVSAAAASAAATAAVAAAAAATGASGSNDHHHQQQQQQQQQGGGIGPASPLAVGTMPHVFEVSEPSTPEQIESPRRPEDGVSGADDHAAAAAAGAADGLGSQQPPQGAVSLQQQQQQQQQQEQGVVSLQQQQQGGVPAEDADESPFTVAGDADAAIAAAEAAAAAAGGSSGGSSGWLSSPAATPRPLRSTGSVGTAVEGRNQKAWRLRQWQQQHQQQQPSPVSLQQQGQPHVSLQQHSAVSLQQQRRILGSPRSCGTTSSAPGAPQQQQQQPQQQPYSSSKSNPGAAAAAAGAAAAAAGSSATSPTEPYDLRVVAHSLGGLSMLVFCVMRAAAGQPHRVRRLVLLSPAGFHDVIPWAWWPFIWVLPFWHKLLVLLLGKERAYHPALLPTYAARGFFFSGLLELARLPAMADLARAAMSAFFGGDASQWERALVMPHYSAAGMPACSLHQALHFIQIINSGRFQLFDYGSPAENMARYGVSRPPDIAAQYWRLANLPVELMAGSHDGIIPPVNVRKHYRAMAAAGLKVTYREFAYGHMDFTSLAAFSIKDEMRYHVLRALNANS